jgi:hypothetical protein
MDVPVPTGLRFVELASLIRPDHGQRVRSVGQGGTNLCNTSVSSHGMTGERAPAMGFANQLLTVARALGSR